MHNTLSTLYSRVTGSADLSLRLFVACGQVADQNNFEEVAYEYFAQAFTIYEEAISDSRAQFQAVCVVASGLHTTRNFGKENYDTLITKCALHGSKLLKKPDQCRAVYLASHLWWATELRALGEEDPKDVGHGVSIVNGRLADMTSFTAMASACSNASSVRSASPMPAWTQQYPSSFSLRS
jgi:vacuolar protein sorting-associated protein 35